MCKKFMQKISVSDTLHFDVDPDPRIHFREYWIRIRRKIEKISIYFSKFFSVFLSCELIIHVY